jgi:hypothetical protein
VLQVRRGLYPLNVNDLLRKREVTVFVMNFYAEPKGIGDGMKPRN